MRVRSEGARNRGIFFARLRRIVDLFNEIGRKIGPVSAIPQQNSRKSDRLLEPCSTSMSLSRPALRHPLESEEYVTDELCHILETWNRQDDSAVSIARARVEPGITTRLHRLHGIAERYYILEGGGHVQIGTLPSSLVAPGDMVYIPPGCPQRISAAGDTDLVFLAVCTPRFVAEAYEDIDSEGDFQHGKHPHQADP